MPAAGRRHAFLPAAVADLALVSPLLAGVFDEARRPARAGPDRGGYGICLRVSNLDTFLTTIDT